MVALLSKSILRFFHCILNAGLSNLFGLTFIYYELQICNRVILIVNGVWKSTKTPQVLVELL